MEGEEFEDIVWFLSTKSRPAHLRGKQHANRFKVLKKKANNYQLVIKRDAQEKEPEKLTLNDVKLLKKKHKAKQELWKIVLRRDQGEELWERFHISDTNGGHKGYWGTYNTISRMYHFPGLSDWIRHKISQCITCTTTTVQSETPPIKATVPKGPLITWQADYIGMFPSDSKDGHRKALVVLDCFSKKMHLGTAYTESSAHYILTLSEAFRVLGKPKHIHTDNGGPFISKGKS